MLVGQDGLEDMEVLYVGCLPVEIEGRDQEVLAFISSLEMLDEDATASEYSMALQMVALELMTQFNCCPVFLGKELKEQFYKGMIQPTVSDTCTNNPWSRQLISLAKCIDQLSRAGFCKQQLWPLFHYLLPLLPNSLGRFNPELWSTYVKANMVGLHLYPQTAVKVAIGAHMHMLCHWAIYASHTSHQPQTSSKAVSRS